MTGLRRALALMSTVAFTFSMAVTPAVALVGGGDLSDALCEPEGGHVLAARGGDGFREKDTGQEVRDLPGWAKGRAPAGFTVSVPVYFHVITDGGLGNLTDAQIRAQIRVLNVTFGGGEGGYDTGFEFDLAGISRTDNAAWFYLQGHGAEANMKQALKQGGDNALNVYSNSGAGYLGWAYLPSITDSSQSYLDGIVLNWQTVPGASDAYEGRYDDGETLTHEAGHWLNLEHTFYGGCNKGDFVDDTPPQKWPTGGCPEGKDTCRQPGLDPIHNYMDYSYDSCYTEFTAGQGQRMADAWLLYRAP